MVVQLSSGSIYYNKETVIWLDAPAGQTVVLNGYDVVLMQPTLRVEGRKDALYILSMEHLGLSLKPDSHQSLAFVGRLGCGEIMQRVWLNLISVEIVEIRSIMNV